MSVGLTAEEADRIAQDFSDDKVRIGERIQSADGYWYVLAAIESMGNIEEAEFEMKLTLRAVPIPQAADAIIMAKYRQGARP